LVSKTPLGGVLEYQCFWCLLTSVFGFFFFLDWVKTGLRLKEHGELYIYIKPRDVFSTPMEIKGGLHRMDDELVYGEKTEKTKQTEAYFEKQERLKFFHS
jgi:hypothetical protein